MNPLDRILDRIPQARRTGHSYRAPCPGHGGDNASALSITEAEDGAILLYCHTRGCKGDDIMRAIGLEPRDLFPEGHPGQRGQRPTSGWSWKRAKNGRPPKDPIVVETERFAVDVASLTLFKLLYAVEGLSPTAEDAAAAEIAPYNAVVEDLWTVYSEHQRHEEVRAAWLKLLPHLQWSAPNLVAAVQRLTQAHLRAVTAAAGEKTPVERGRKAAELLAKTFAPPKEIVPELLFEGLTMLVGKPKVGKSRLLLAIAVAVASGGKVLGALAVDAGAVLYISLEDHERRLQKRLKGLLGHAPCPDTLEYEREWRRLDEGGLEDLELWVARHPDAKLIIIDTFKRIRSRKHRNGSAYDEDYEALEGLQDFCNRHQGLAVVVNHHENKLGAVDDWMDRASGSTGLTGGVDGAASLRRQRGSTDAILTITHRDIDTDEGQYEYALKSDQETGGWSLMGAAVPYQLSKERQAVLTCLQTADGPMTPKAIARLLGRSSESALNALYKLLHDMLLAEQITSPARGYYAYIQSSKDGKDGKESKDGKDGKDEDSAAILTDLTGSIDGGKDAGKDGSAENPSEKSSNLTDLTDLTDLAQQACATHGMAGMFWEEGGIARCGICLEMPMERIELFRRRHREAS
jgi:AAA domain